MLESKQIQKYQIFQIFDYEITVNPKHSLRIPASNDPQNTKQTKSNNKFQYNHLAKAKPENKLPKSSKAQILTRIEHASFLPSSSSSSSSNLLTSSLQVSSHSVAFVVYELV